MKQNEYYMVLGKSEIYSSGEYLDLALERSRKIKPHHVLVIDIKEVFNLDKVKRIL
jgi:hypothetical protein